MIYFLCPIIMFAALMLWVFICWRIEDRAIDRKIKQKYPNWRNEEIINDKNNKRN